MYPLYACTHMRNSSVRLWKRAILLTAATSPPSCKKSPLLIDYLPLRSKVEISKKGRTTSLFRAPRMGAKNMKYPHAVWYVRPARGPPSVHPSITHMNPRKKGGGQEEVFHKSASSSSSVRFPYLRSLLSRRRSHPRYTQAGERRKEGRKEGTHFNPSSPLSFLRLRNCLRPPPLHPSEEFCPRRC